MTVVTAAADGITKVVGSKDGVALSAEGQCPEQTAYFDSKRKKINELDRISGDESIKSEEISQKCLNYKDRYV